MKEYRFDIFCAVLLMASILTTNDFAALSTALLLTVNALTCARGWKVIRELQKLPQKNNSLQSDDGQPGIKAEDAVKQAGGDE